jgi:hypothetical protein
MRFFILAVISIPAFSNSAFTQIKNPLADVLMTPAEIKLVDSDDRETTLLKQSFNAAHHEMRIRYNYWLQDIGDIAGLLHSIDRLHELRLAIGPATSELEFLEQKLAFAKELETHCEKANSKAKSEAVRQIDEASTKAFRIRTELEIARLKKVAITDKGQAIPNVIGTVLRVSEERGDLVEISLGSDDGVRVGMKLDVFIPGQYRGKVEVRKVLPDKSAAQVLPDYSKDKILPNDQVATRLQ